MNAVVERHLAEVTIDTLERLGFLFASVAEEPPAPSEAALGTVGVAFEGSFAGELEVSLSGPVLTELAANMLGTMEGDPLSFDQQLDALKELANVICGNLLPVIAGSETEFTIGAPGEVAPDRPVWTSPTARCHLVLENGICRVRLRTNGGVLPDGIEGAARPMPSGNG
jgi:hypothetical protein